LLSVGCEVARNKGGASGILTLWKSSALIDETGEGFGTIASLAWRSCSRFWKGTLLLSEENFRLLRKIFFGFREEGYCTKSKQARFISFSLTLVLLSFTIFRLVTLIVELFRV
jgi:hypothetical protein